VEVIRDQRLRNGSWTLNRYRAEIGEPPVDGGDDAVLVDRQNLVLWQDMAAMSKAMVAGKGAPGVAAGETPPGGEPLAAGQGPALPPGQVPPLPAETLRAVQMAAYQRRLLESYARRPVLEAAPKAVSPLARKVYSQLKSDFPAESIAWVLTTEWQGPKNVGEDHVDTHDRDQWAASKDGKLPLFVAKLHRKLAAGSHLKPCVLVRPAGDKAAIIADGHHRVLASIDEGQPVWAYVGKVATEDGPWSSLHTHQNAGHVDNTLKG
jgi:hypothetical protein